LYFIDSYFLLLYNKFILSILLRNPAPDIRKHKYLHSLISELTSNPDVQKVSVNSTLTRKYIRDDDECLADDGEERETEDGKKRDRDDGKERKTDDGEERETDDSGERETYDGEKRETDDGKERETDDGEERKTKYGKEKETEDGDHGSQLLPNRMQKKFSKKLGKALIIFNQHEVKQRMSTRDLKTAKCRQKASKDAMTVLKDYFAFEVNFAR